MLAADNVTQMQRWLDAGMSGLRIFTTGTTMPGQADWLDDDRGDVPAHSVLDTSGLGLLDLATPRAGDALAEGFRTRWGRYVLEVLPPIAATKGSAVRHLLDASGLRRGLYAGDDTTDLDGFAALDGLETAVRIAVVSAEGPAELGERADLRVGSTDAFRELLGRL